MEANEKKGIYILLTVISVILAFFILYTLRVSALSPGADFGVDVYYHIRAGDMFPFISTTKEFPWAVMSVWETSFSDKELGFHFIIFLLRKITGFLGVSSSPPFNIISSFFFASLLILYGVWSYFACRKYSFLIPILLVFISPLFFQKLIIIRPNLASTFLYSVAVFILLGGSSFYRKVFYIFIVGWLYSLFYSVPYLLVIPLLIYCIVCLFTDCEISQKRNNFLLLLSGVLGLLVGLTIHPQFPNTFTNLYIQGYEVILNILGLSGSKVGLGEGLKPPVVKTLLQNSLIFLLLIINILLYSASYKENREKKLFLVILQVIMTIGFFFSKRMIEYAVPSIIICFAYLIGNFQNQGKSFLLFFSKLKVLLPIAVIFIFVTVPINKNVLPKLLLPPCYDFGKWQKKNLPKGTYIGLLNFGDFPRLFYTSPELKYSMALDPMFSYYVYPERSNIIEQFRLGNNTKITPKELAGAIGTRLLYASKYCHLAVMYLLEKGARLIYYDKEGCLLRL